MLHSARETRPPICLLELTPWLVGSHESQLKQNTMDQVNKIIASILDSEVPMSGGAADTDAPQADIEGGMNTIQRVRAQTQRRAAMHQKQRGAYMSMYGGNMSCGSSYKMRGGSANEQPSEASAAIEGGKRRRRSPSAKRSGRRKLNPALKAHNAKTMAIYRSLQRKNPGKPNNELLTMAMRMASRQ